jgi:hypothetical protein
VQTTPQTQPDEDQAGQALSPTPPAGQQTVPAAAEATAPQTAATDKVSLFGLSLSWYTGIILGAILLLALISFLTVKRLQTSPNRTFAHAAGKAPKRVSPVRKPAPSGDNEPPEKRSLLTGSTAYRNSGENRETGPEIPLAKEKPKPPTPVSPVAGTALRVPKPAFKQGSGAGFRKIAPIKPRKQDRNYQGPLMLSLFVEDQNTNIGRRNIHVVKAGYSFTIGGGKSDFLIFLVPMPPRIAELHSDGTQCTLVPRRPEFFPDIGSQQIPDCIGKPIRIISERHYELIMRIDRYEDPLVALNRLLHSVDVPGYPRDPV